MLTFSHLSTAGLYGEANKLFKRLIGYDSLYRNNAKFWILTSQKWARDDTLQPGYELTLTRMKDYV